MLIYHGSKQIIKNPTFGLGKDYNDYGKGFYCTEDLNLAKEWASGLNQNGYANIYEIACDNLSIINLNSEQFCILHWLGILLQNREFDSPSALAIEAKAYIAERFSVPYQNYDIIIGYRADDSYFSFAQDFINGTISYRQLSNAMRLGNLGTQFVLKSRAAFDCIRFLNYEVAEQNEWYARKEFRDQTARREYFDIERNKRQRSDLYITNIIDEGMDGSDPRLR